MTILMMNSMMFMMFKHPMTMGMILLSQSLIMAIMTSKLSMNSWFSYILFLVMIGGLIILFIYMTSISSNNKFNTFKKMNLLSLTPPLMLMMINEKEKNSINNNMLNKELFLTMLNKFMNTPSNWIYLTIILYLLITLIVVIKITNNMKMPLRMKK